MSSMSTKNKRQISKEATKELILEKTKDLIIDNGIVNTSTKVISDYCKVAHGTIFSQFGNRENLISTIIKKELTEIARQLYELKKGSHSLEGLLSEYLKLVEVNERFLVVINKEFSFLVESLQRDVITTESIVKNMFYNEIEAGIKSGRFKDSNIKVVISFLFGTINYYLSRREYFVSDTSIIKQKKQDIIKAFMNLIKK